MTADAPRVQRRLAAILAADVVGFSALMGRDEEGTLAQVKSLRREVIDPKVKEHHGRVFKTTGDGFLVEFASPVEAVRCAVGIHEALAMNAAQEPSYALQLRIGINLGDILIEEDGDVYGDGVNVAARLEQIAPSPGICISGKVYEEVRDKLPYAFDDRGEQQVKNIARPVRAYSLVGFNTHASAAAAKPLAVLDKPSIAVLPFDNMSGDPAQDYFCDGVVEDIITALSHLPWLFVIARTSTFTYKGRAVDVKQIGKELGVRYIVQGGIRRSGDKLRITAQLTDVANASNLWAERYDRQVTDVFDLQDEITASVAGALEPSLRLAEIERAKQKRPENLRAYDLYLRSLPPFYSMTREGSDEAIRLLRDAIALEPDYAIAWSALAYCLAWRVSHGWSTMGEVGEEALHYTRRALGLDKNNSDALAIAARLVVYIHQRYDEALALATGAIESNPSSAFAYTQKAWVHLHAEEPIAGQEAARYAVRLSPRDTMNYDTWHGLAFAALLNGAFQEGVDAARRAVQYNPAHVPAVRTLAAALALSGHLGEARLVAQDVIRLDPGFSINKWRNRRTYRNGAQVYDEGLRLAGLPE
jgi:adenylate cyclase